METIEEASARLDSALAALRALKADQGSKVRKAWELEYQMAKRALALAVLEEARHHGTSDSTIARLRARIERLA